MTKFEKKPKSEIDDLRSNLEEAIDLEDSEVPENEQENEEDGTDIESVKSDIENRVQEAIDSLDL